MVSFQPGQLLKPREQVAQKLCSDVRECMRTNCNLQMRRLICESHGQVIVLRGRVDSYYYKQLAQELVRKIDRHVRIVNVVTVAEPR